MLLGRAGRKQLQKVQAAGSDTAIGTVRSTAEDCSFGPVAEVGMHRV